jgi:hypothetical protein
MCSLAWGVGLMGPHAAPALASQFPPSNGRGLIHQIERTYLSADTVDMAKKREPPKPIIWSVYKIAGKAM